MTTEVECKLVMGDFYNELPKMRMKSVDMILTDLPYNITANIWETEINLIDMWCLFRHVLKENGVICLTSVQPFTSKLVMSNLKMFKHEWIWEKDAGSNFANAVREPMKEHENVLIFSNGSWIYNPIRQERIGSRKGKQTKSSCTTNSENYGKFKPEIKWNVPELRLPRSIQRFKRERGLHPTQKPVELFEYLIKTYTNEGDLVLDCCAGSGTTAVACINTKRNYICIEKNEEYFKIIQDRIAKLTEVHVLH